MGKGNDEGMEANAFGGSPLDQSGQLPPNPLLTQDEINALINAIPSMHAGLKVEGPTSSAQEKVGVKKYDFTMPIRLSREHLKSLNALHNSFAKAFSSFLSMSLRDAVEIDCTSIEQLTYGEYLSSLFDPACAGVFSMKPLKGVGVLEISLPLAFLIIDKLLGGTGVVQPYSRGLTVVEEMLITKVMERSLEILQDSWQRSIDLRIRLERLENNPQFIHAAATGDPVILIMFDVRLGSVHSIMSLCFPFLTIQQALASLRKEEMPNLVDETASASYRNIMCMHVSNLCLPISARYSPSPVTLGELLELKKGDIIKLTNAKKDEVEILVGGQSRFRGKPGMINGRRAVQLLP